MTFIEQFETELISKLRRGGSEEEIARWARERVLESYRNGITAGRNGATVKRKGESRRRGVLGKKPAAGAATEVSVD